MASTEDIGGDTKGTLRMVAGCAALSALSLWQEAWSAPCMLRPPAQYRGTPTWLLLVVQEAGELSVQAQHEAHSVPQLRQCRRCLLIPLSQSCIISAASCRCIRCRHGAAMLGLASCCSAAAAAVAFHVQLVMHGSCQRLQSEHPIQADLNQGLSCTHPVCFTLAQQM